jgi:hypothetical protein
LLAVNSILIYKRYCESSAAVFSIMSEIASSQLLAHARLTPRNGGTQA